MKMDRRKRNLRVKEVQHGKYYAYISRAHNIRSCMRTPLLCAFLLLLFATAARAQTPCGDIQVTTNKGCIPLPVTFSFTSPNTSPMVSYHWDFGDGDSSSQSDPTHIFKNSGSYTVTVTVIFKNGTKCTITLSKPIVVYSNPVVDFTVNNSKPIILCQRGDKLCFIDKSGPGADKAPIVSRLWSFGDGTLSSAQNPCYAYSDSGTYLVTLEVADSNGCKNYIQKKITVRFTTDIGISPSPKFSIYIAYDCKHHVDNVSFFNQTDTAGQFITRYIWDFNDKGAMDSCDLTKPGCLKDFDTVVHTYKDSGLYIPSLYIQNKYGCSNKAVIDTPITIQNYKLTVKVFPTDPHCFSPDSLVEFEVPFNSQARSYTWDFGDPNDRSTGVGASTAHRYKKPGVYNVGVQVAVGSCLYDTFLCERIRLMGPIALIFPIKETYLPWDSVPPNGNFLISPKQKTTYFDTSCHGSNYVNYYTYSPVFVPKGEPVYDTCRADTVVKVLSLDSLPQCNGTKKPDISTTYVPHIKGYKDTTEQSATLHVWSKGSPVPGGNLYFKPPFVNRPLYMDDTSLFSIRCMAPQKITFTNFSTKFRGYYALDNDAVNGYPNKCKNPVYPYASDSLMYHWDFKEGDPGISSQASPVITDRYSEQKLPTHLFQKNGCYWVVLTVSDTVTNCMDQDSVPVVLEAADAGWAPQYSNIKNMTWLIQDSLPAKGPRRGMIISMPPCIEDTQIINLNETLPSCYKRQFSMVLDSAKQAITCDNTTQWAWYYRDSIANYFAYHFLYSDTGWKSVGLVIQNNYNCKDTVWYHNYKYIHGTYPDIFVSAEHICAGDTLKMTPKLPQQVGIKSFVYYYAEQRDYGDTIAHFTNDTIRHRLVKEPSGKIDTITSTVHNKLWGYDDGPLSFDYLTDTARKVVPLPGHFSIMTVIKSRFGCLDTGRTQVTVGHYSDNSVDNSILCVNDTAHFQGLAQYYIPFKPSNDGYDQRLFWLNPDSVRHGRKPLIPELMQWDFDGDGVIDATGCYPSFVYTKPGSYTVTLYTTDSSGCMQKLIKKDMVKVIDASAYFVVDSPGDTRNCNSSHFFTFHDSSWVIKPFKDSLNQYRIVSWTWDFGDGTPAITITDSTRKNAGHVYTNNGDFTVTLTVSTSRSGGGKNTGCSKTYKLPVHILGPVAHFSIVGPNAGCVPFTLVVRDESKKADQREWILGDGTSVSSNGDSLVYLTYKRSGVFCPQLYVVDSLFDLQGKIIYCADTFPRPKCTIKVVVYDTNKQVLTASDTLVCVGAEPINFKSAPDTGYKSWTIHYGNGDTAQNSPPAFTYLYEKTGKYHVTINGYGAHCPDTSSVNIHVIDVKADFAVDTAKKDTPVFSFINKSLGGVKYMWEWGDGTAPTETTSLDEISHEFMKAGKVMICLTAYNQKGCFDTVCHNITIDTFLFIPNVFTPNGDALNNHFVISIYGNKLYDLDIFNRWGEKVFHSNDKNNTWDGSNHTTGQLYPDGVYYAVFTYRFIGGRTEHAQTAVHMFRH